MQNQRHLPREQERQLPPLPSTMGGGVGKIALRTELFSSLLSSEVTFLGIVDSLVQENFSEGMPQNPSLTLYY